jgi:hypothetical protein
VLRRDHQDLARGVLRGRVLIVEPFHLRAVEQQVRVLRVLRESFLEHPARVAQAAPLQEVERLLGEDGGARGLVVHGLNDARESSG